MIKFKIAAYTDAAGKMNQQAPRNGNEDNMYVCASLCKEEDSYLFISDREEELSKYGCLMVVADGMGGMNAGEVASEIAINVVKESFSKDTINENVFRDTKTRTDFLESIIVKADSAIKDFSKSHSECDGMGSTIIIVWLYNGLATVSWCGDSRAYLFRPTEGLRQISKDHSYVQGLVDDGKITVEEAFDHPYGNIITRSLGDPNSKAKPDSVTISIFKDDIILVNSDGLNGVLRDNEIESIIRANCNEMGECRQALWKAAENADWYDNVTAILCKITEGELYDATNTQTSHSKGVIQFQIKKSIFYTIIFALVLVILACIYGKRIYSFTKESIIEYREKLDSLQGGTPSDTLEIKSESKIEELPNDELKSETEKESAPQKKIESVPNKKPKVTSTKTDSISVKSNDTTTSASRLTPVSPSNNPKN